jgi:hypothetical protein
MIYGGNTHSTDSQNSDTTASSGRELYRLQFSLQAASPETSGYNLVYTRMLEEEQTMKGPRSQVSLAGGLLILYSSVIASPVLKSSCDHELIE